MSKTPKPKKTAKNLAHDKQWGEIMDLLDRYDKFGTIEESWAALRGIAAALKNGQTPTDGQSRWFVSAIQRCKANDESQLLRELGLVTRGRRRTVNPDVVSGRVAELIKGGSSIMAACEQASEELGCTTKTAHRWYKQGLGSSFDGRKK